MTFSLFRSRRLPAIVSLSAVAAVALVTTACASSTGSSAANIDPVTATSVSPPSSPVPSTAASAVPSGHVLDGEPVTARTASTPIDVVTDVPPAPAGTASFSTTSKISVKPMHTTAIHAGCPAGWYVRPGTPGYYTRTDPVASFSYWDEEWVFHVEDDDAVSGTISNPNGGTIFSNLSVSFYNSSMISSHGASITYWCDAVPSWYTSSASVAQAHLTIAAAAGRSVPAAGRSVGQIGPVPSNCWYCAQNSQLINMSTGQALDPSTASDGSPVQVNPVTDSASQDWYLQGDTGGSVFKDGTATFGLWQEAFDLSTAVGVSGTNAVWASASASPPSGGQFYYVDQGAGMIRGAVQLISTDTNLCLADPASSGGQAVMVTCDATDATQWWTVKPAV